VAIRRSVLKPVRLSVAVRRTRFFKPAAAAGGGGGTTPPTAVTTADLVAGTGTRAFGAVTTQAGDFVVVGIQVENAQTAAFTPSGTGTTWPGAANADSGQVGLSRGRALIWVGSDTAGGSRTITITASAGINYRARLTVVRGSTGVGGTGASSTLQNVSVARTGDDSMILMGVTDWSAGAVGSPVWTPGGSTTASEQQAGVATYIFGRWDDSGPAGTASHGITTPTYTTPTVAALEMLGTAGGGTTVTGAATLPVTATLSTDAATTQPAAASVAATATLTTAADHIIPAAASLAVTATLSTTGGITPYVVGTPTSVTGSAVTTTALAWDAGAAAGDLLMMWVSQIGAQAISSTSLGLTQPTGARVVNGSNNAGLTLLTKALTAGDITAGTVTATFAASQVYVVTLVVVRRHSGVDSATITTGSGTATTTVSVPAETPVNPDSLILGGVGGRAATAATDITWTWPGPLASLTQINSTGAGNRAYLTLAQQPAPGAAVSSGPDAPVPSSSIAYGAFRVAVAPAGVGQTFTGDASLPVTATLSAAAVTTQPAAASIAATASLTVTPALAAVSTASVAATATLTATAAATLVSTASVAATATLTTAAAVTRAGAASIAATATLSPAATLTALGTATLAVTATLTPSSGTTTATVTLPVTATLSPAAILTAVTAAAITASATLSPAASLGAVTTAALAVTATLTTSGARAAIGAASLAITATLTPGPVSTQLATLVALAVTATLTPAAAIGVVVQLAAVATLTTTAARTANAAAAVSTTATLTTAATSTKVAAVALAATAALVPAGTLAARAAATIATLASLIVTGEVVAAFTVGALSAGSSSTTSITGTSTPGAVLTATSARGGPS
jgi:hypothetical protein